MNSQAFEAYLLDALKSRQWRAGQRIPTERDFSLQTGLGRSAIRRVLTTLKLRGLIVQTVGSGTYVSHNVPELLGDAAQSPLVNSVSPAELMNARIALEPAILDLVVGHASAADFARMQECCDKAEAAKTLADFERWDSLLHEVIAQSTHNALVLGVFQLLTDARSAAEWGMLKRQSASPARRQDYQRQHRALVAALMQRDAQAAKMISRDHLIHVRHNMLGY